MFFSKGNLLTENDSLQFKNRLKSAWGTPIEQGFYSLGGYSVFQTEFNMALYGYDNGFVSGHHYSLGNVSYSFPLFTIFKGWGVKPLFLRHVYLSVLANFGQVSNAGYSSFTFDSFYTAYAVELSFASLVAYHVPLDFKIGYAYAYNTKGNTVYFSVAMPLGETFSLTGHIRRKYYKPFITGNTSN